jgi:hypothetical protein
MRLRFHGNQAIRIHDAAPSANESIPEKISLAEILERNRKLWAQGQLSPAIANVSQHDLLRAMNKRNRDFWDAR